MNNLNQLNDILFETLNGVREDKVDEKKASAIVQLSNSIINNGKLQLSAYKLAKTEKAPEMFGLPEAHSSGGLPEGRGGENPEPPTKKDRHQEMMNFALHLGYNSVSDAISDLKKENFLKKFELWIKNN